MGTDCAYISLVKAIPIKCFVSHRPPSCEGGSVGWAKKVKNEHMKGLGASEGRAAKPVVSAPNTVTASPGKKNKKP